MMDDILKQIKAGEVSGMQFKERILHKYDTACELVAFSNQVEDHDTGLRHSDTDLDTKKVTLTNKEKDIVNFCSEPRTAKEILDRIGVSMHSKNRERYITSLVAAGYLQMTNPDNPTASNQKYKKVNKKCIKVNK